MNIKGKLEAIMPTNKVSDKFSKREFVVEYAENPQYPELIKLEFIQDKCDILDDYSEGDTVDVQFNLKGRKWEKDGKISYFNTLQAWKISKEGNEPDPRTEPNKTMVYDMEEDLLPF